MTDPSSPTAFVAWAHRGHGWTADQEQAWAEQVSTFTALLRLNGVEADVDLYHLHERGMDWNRYGFQSIAEHKLVFVPVSKSWIDRFEGSERPTAGAGAAREADALLDLYNDDRDAFRRKVSLVYLPGTDTRDTPVTLGGLQRFTVSELTRDGLDDVLRYAHQVPRWERPALGATPDFSPHPQMVTDAAATDLRALGWTLHGSTPAGDAAVRGIEAALTAMQSAPRDTPSPPAPSADAAGPGAGWQPVADPATPLTTTFDQLGNNGVYGPVLEVQLVALDPTPRISAPALRATAATAVEALTPPAATVDPIMGAGQDEPVQPSVDLRSDQLSVTCPEPRATTPFGGRASVTLAQMAEVVVSRTGSVAAALYLPHDTFGALVNTASLTADVNRLLTVAATFLPASADRVIPIARIGPLQRVSPGDPSDMGGTTRSLPWTGRSASTDGADSIDRASLTSTGSAEELAAQLVDALRSRR